MPRPKPRRPPSRQKRSRWRPHNAETTERPFDLVAFRRELIAGTRAMLGIRITPPDAKR